MKQRLFLAFVLFWCCGGFLPLVAQPVYNEKLELHWFDNDNKCWYRSESPGKRFEFLIVDTKSGNRTPAFDHVRVAQSLAKNLGVDVTSFQLPIETLDFSQEEQVIFLMGPTNRWKLDLRTYEIEDTFKAGGVTPGLKSNALLKKSRAGGVESEIIFVNQSGKEVKIFWFDPDGNKVPYGSLNPGEERRQHTFQGHVWSAGDQAGKVLATFEASARSARAVISDAAVVAPRLPTVSAPVQRSSRSSSPDRRWEAFVKDHQLVIRNTQSAEETVLSSNATPAFSFHKNTTADRAISMNYEKSEAPPDVAEVFWSPDSSRLIALQTRVVEERKVFLVESAPRDQLHPKLISYPYLKAGDPLPEQSPRLFDIESKREIMINNTLFTNAWTLGSFRWAPDGKRFTFLYNQRGHQVMRVVAVDASTGAAKAIIEELSSTFIDYSSKSYYQWLGETEIVWMSERDGWNHLYLYDAQEGRLIKQITKGNWNVRSVEQLDRDSRSVVFRSCGMNPGIDPYYFDYCRVSLNGRATNQDLQVLTAGDGTHKIEWSPNRRFFMDTSSRVDSPPVHRLRNGLTGSVICELEKADASELLQKKKSPERFVAKGRDGVTDIYGIIHRPAKFDPAKKYPVVENIYAGPHGFFVPKEFQKQYGHQESLTSQGFIVVQIDGMGTSWRSRAFHDVAWKNLRDAGFPDRILWIKAAARQYPQIDLSRVGIYGGSAGGQNAAAAVLWHGDFYKAAVADCGCHDNRMDKIWWNEQFMGWPVGKEYEENSNTAHASLLTGKLLLMVGELDKNVDPATSFQFANALSRAGKEFEFCVVPGSGHGSAETPYGSRKRVEFLKRQLLP